MPPDDSFSKQFSTSRFLETITVFMFFPIPIFHDVRFARDFLYQKHCFFTFFNIRALLAILSIVPPDDSFSNPFSTSRCPRKTQIINYVLIFFCIFLVCMCACVFFVFLFSVFIYF